MRYIRNYNSFRKFDKLNEEFIGGALKNLFGKLKKKASIKLSKEIGSAKEIDKLIEQYKQDYLKNAQQKLEAQKKWVEYEKGLAAGGEEDEKMSKELQGNYEKLKKALDGYKDKLKAKFEAQFKDILDEENDDRVKSYIKLKKLEMAQELAAEELKMIQEDLGVTDEERKENENLDEMLSNIENQVNGINQKIEETTQEIESGGGEESPSFPFEDARKKPEGFLWDGSPFEKEDFKQGDGITYWSAKHFKEGHDNAEGKGDEYTGTKAFVGSDDKQKEQEKGNIFISLSEDNPDKGFSISKKAIITTAKADEAKAEADEEKAKEEAKTDEESEV